MDSIRGNFGREGVLPVREALPEAVLQGLVHGLNISRLRLRSEVVGLDNRSRKRQLPFLLLASKTLPSTGASAFPLWPRGLPCNSCLVTSLLHVGCSVALLQTGLLCWLCCGLGSLLDDLVPCSLHCTKGDQYVITILCIPIGELQTSLLCTGAKIHVAHCCVEDHGDVVVIAVARPNRVDRKKGYEGKRKLFVRKFGHR